jgi:hypothetical protein
MAQKEWRAGAACPRAIIPNVLDFETPPPVLDDYNREFPPRDRIAGGMTG